MSSSFIALVVMMIVILLVFGSMLIVQAVYVRNEQRRTAREKQRRRRCENDRERLLALRGQCDWNTRRRDGSSSSHSVPPAHHRMVVARPLRLRSHGLESSESHNIRSAIHDVFNRAWWWAYNKIDIEFQFPPTKEHWSKEKEYQYLTPFIDKLYLDNGLTNFGRIKFSGGQFKERLPNHSSHYVELQEMRHLELMRVPGDFSGIELFQHHDSHTDVNYLVADIPIHVHDDHLTLDYIVRTSHHHHRTDHANNVRGEVRAVFPIVDGKVDVLRPQTVMLLDQLVVDTDGKLLGDTWMRMLVCKALSELLGPLMIEYALMRGLREGVQKEQGRKLLSVPSDLKQGIVGPVWVCPGNVSRAGRACCAYSCSKCGGGGCSHRGAHGFCCTSNVQRSGPCTARGPPCMTSDGKSLSSMSLSLSPALERSNAHSRSSTVATRGTSLPSDVMMLQNMAPATSRMNVLFDPNHPSIVDRRLVPKMDHDRRWGRRHHFMPPMLSPPTLLGSSPECGKSDRPSDWTGIQNVMSTAIRQTLSNMTNSPMPGMSDVTGSRFTTLNDITLFWNGQFGYTEGGSTTNFFSHDHLTHMSFAVNSIHGLERMFDEYSGHKPRVEFVWKDDKLHILIPVHIPLRNWSVRYSAWMSGGTKTTFNKELKMHELNGCIVLFGHLHGDALLWDRLHFDEGKSSLHVAQTGPKLPLPIIRNRVGSQLEHPFKKIIGQTMQQQISHIMTQIVGHSCVRHLVDETPDTREKGSFACKHCDV